MKKAEMNKKELVKAITDHEDRPYRVRKGEVEKIVDLVFDLVKTSLASGTNVRISEFGKFEVKEQKARPVRNPRTGDKLTIPAKQVVKFAPSKAFKEAVDA